MGAELSMELMGNFSIFDEYGNICESIKCPISIIKLVLPNCSTIPNKIGLHLEEIRTLEEVRTNNYFDIDHDTHLIFYKNLIIGEIIDAVPIDNNLLIIVQNIGIEKFIINNVIQAIKKHEEKKKILNNEFIPAISLLNGSLCSPGFTQKSL
jgi:hypothetical protein